MFQEAPPCYLCRKTQGLIIQRVQRPGAETSPGQTSRRGQIHALPSTEILGHSLSSMIEKVCGASGLCNEVEDSNPQQSPVHSRGSTNACSAAAAKSLQSCQTLCDLIDSSPPGSSIPGVLQARTLEWVAISFSNA